jgi:uncharacterized membrane protein HdeD (DUF308 family)
MTARQISRTGWILLAIGALCLLAPFAATTMLAVLIGAFLLVAGSGEVADAMRRRPGANLVAGGRAAACGLVIVMRPGAGVAFLTTVVAVYLLAAGAWRCRLAWIVRPAAGWKPVFLHGALTVVLGVLVVAGWPLAGAWIIGISIGLHLFLRGALLASIGRQAAA